MTFGLLSAPALRTPLTAAVFVCAAATLADAQTVPAPWTARDIGAPHLGGSSSASSGGLRIDAAGADIWGTRDEFHFVYQQVSGDVDIIARVDSLSQTDVWAKAGVMIRSSLSSSAAHGFALASAAYGVHFQRRRNDAAESHSTAGYTPGAPVWVRAVRSGTRVTAYWSTNGSSWVEVGTDTLALGSSAYVGVAVTSHNPHARTTAVVSNVRVTQSGPQEALPAGQHSVDIGGPAIPGSATFSHGTYRIRGGGVDIWDTRDQFQFVYQPLTGNGEIVARVASITHTDMWAKAGVMIRESLTAGSRHAMVVTTPAAGYAFQRRPEPGAWSDHTTGGVGTAPGWVRLVRTGSFFEAYRSSDGSTWTRIGADSIPMGETVYVGLAVTSHNAGAATDVVIDSFRVTATGASPANQPPAVSLTAPANGAQFTAPASVTLAASATDPENRMLAVEFYAGTTLLARDTTAPYSATWSVSTAGTYTLTAVAYDADGNQTTSAPIDVSIAAAAIAVPRSVAFTASSDHATNVTSYLFEVFANGANPSTATPVATSDLGKPAPSSNGTITVDRSTFFSSLAPGSYVATVTAVGPGGRTRGSPATFTR